MTGIERAKESESSVPGYTRCGWLKQPKTIPMLFLGVATVGEKRTEGGMAERLEGLQ
jgi:hypothetical protein